MSYTSFCQVTVLHSYYASNICECLPFHASVITDGLFSQYGFVMQQTTNGFVLLSPTNQSIETLLNLITQTSGQTAFDFDSFTVDPLFLNFTDAPINKIGPLIYTSDQAISESSNTNIQLKELFSDADEDQIARNSRTATLKITIKFEDIIRLLKISDNIKFNIQLKARKVQLNYIIINSNNHKFDQLVIEGDNEVQFGQAQETTLQNGEKALLFSSETAEIQLRNKADYTFNLVEIKSSPAGERKEIIPIRLPLPDPRHVEVNNDDALVSVYVYL